MQESMDVVIENAMAIISTYGLRVVGAIVVLIVGRMVAGGVRRGVRRMMKRRETDPTLIPFVSSLVYYLVIAFVVIAVLGLFGIPTASFVAVLGAAGLAVGLALQGTLSNFAAGVMLLVFRPFKVGDVVEAGGATGKVVAIKVAVGDDVSAGQSLVVLEAMKMENELAAEQSGRVSEIHVSTGETVDGGGLLLELE